MEILFWITVSIIILIGLLIGILFTFYFIQERLIFSPIRLPKNYPYPFKGDFEERNYEVDKGVFLNSLLFKVPNSKGLIFYIHGNADNLRYWGDFAAFFNQLGYDVFMYDYRGFGKSGGKISSEKQLHADANKLYEELLNEYPPERVVIYGFSIGTGIATKLASNSACKLLILEAPYFNFLELVNYHKAYLPASLISKYRFRINRLLPKIEVPIFIFHGTDDRKVPFYLGAKLDGLNQLLTFISVEHATHNDMQAMETYQLKMKEILAD
tara:strand:+ start:27 stop:833 length:807 start_codon:yes stop_codon:yes gene_type:complete